MRHYTIEEIAGVTDHTFLKTEQELGVSKQEHEKRLRGFLEEMTVFAHKPYAVCVRSENVAFSRKELDRLGCKDVKIAAVVGFPDGNAYDARAKLVSTAIAVSSGADEIDMVLRYDDWRKNNTLAAAADVNTVCGAAHGAGALCKVILETTMLEPWQVYAAGQMALDEGADFIKTGTGYPIPAKYGRPAMAAMAEDGFYKNKGATLDDLLIMRKIAGADRGVKPAGGVNEKNVHQLLTAALTHEGRLLFPAPQIVRIGASSLLKKLYGRLARAGY